MGIDDNMNIAQRCFLAVARLVTAWCVAVSVFWVWTLIQKSSAQAMLFVFWIAAPSVGLGLVLGIMPAVMILKGLGHEKTVWHTVITLLLVALEAILLLIIADNWHSDF